MLYSKPNIGCVKVGCVKVASDWWCAQNPPLAPKVVVSLDCLALGWPTGGIWLAVCIFFSKASTLVSRCAPVNSHYRMPSTNCLCMGRGPPKFTAYVLTYQQALQPVYFPSGGIESKINRKRLCTDLDLNVIVLQR